MGRPAFTLLLLSFLIFGGNSGCNKDETPTLFDMVYVLNVDMPAALNTIQTHFVEFNKVPTNIESILVDHGLTEADVARIEPYDGQLEVILAPVDLAYFQEIFVEIMDGQSRLECFYTPSVPLNTGTRVVLVGTLADFKPLLTQSAMNLRMGFRLRNPSPSSLSFTLRLTFKAKA
ncbi:MAG: hypothetical protein K9I85_11365 [Saprospiraceae bacterium]|nr:hypothetical protein [Saprospiraceae bacterium]